MKDRLKKLSALLIVLALSITMFAGTLTLVNAVPVIVIDGNYQIELHDVDYDPSTNLQNWTYNITCLDGHGISHIVFEFKTVCDPPISAIEEGVWGPYDNLIELKDYAHPDPTTQASGIKFEFEPSLEPGNWMLVWFTLKGEWPVGTIEVYVKAGSDATPTGESVFSGVVDGPECMPDNRIPEVPLGSIMAVASMIGALSVYVLVRKRNVKSS